MNTIAKTFTATVLAAPLMAAPCGAADSVVRVHDSDGAGFERFLPEAAADIPWLANDRHARPKLVRLPDAGSVSAWMLSPKPAEAWRPRRIQSPASAMSFAGM